MASDNSAPGCAGGLIGLLVVGVFLLFLGLKLGEVGVVATWSWWWVTAPLWIYFSFLLIVVLLFLFFFVLAALLSSRR